MASRALIVAIEDYPDMPSSLTRTLPGTLEAGRRFGAWLRDKWTREGVPPAEQELIFCSEPQEPDGRKATATAIRGALRELRDHGQGSTEELFVFFSGHGFAYADNRQLMVDYILTSDCVSPADSPGCCLPVDQLVDWLRSHMGPGRQYFFIDACRNVLTIQEADPGTLGVPKGPFGNGEPSTFLLQSTRSGNVASANSPFPGALLLGLGGAGTAKAYDTLVSDTAMFVNFESLYRFVRTMFRDQRPIRHAGGDVTEREAVLAKIEPIPTVARVVRVDGSSPTDRVRVIIRGKEGPKRAEQSIEFTGPEQTLTDLPPDEYQVAVQIAGFAVDPPEATLNTFEDGGPLTFRKGRPTPDAGFHGVPMGPLLGDRIGVTRGGPDARRDAWNLSEAHRSIAEALPHSPEGVDFSESLGEVRDADLDVWLAILGGGRVMPQRIGDYSKIARLPLYDFTAEAPGAAPVYILAAVRDGRLDVSVSDDVTPHWQPTVQPGALAGVRHLHVANAPGPKLVSFRIPGSPTRTVISLASPNRATLVTVTQQDDGTLHIWQYLLPLGHLIAHLPDVVRTHVETRSNPLHDLRCVAAATRAFRRRRDIGKELPPRKFDELMSAKWVDPIGSALAAYQALRRGQRDRLDELALNMVAAFPELPDSYAIAKLVGLREAHPQGVPLFLDGLKAFPGETIPLPLSEKLLDCTGPWTSWRRAV
jgi:hypothetical protein